MPAFPGWYIRVPQILESLSLPSSPPFLDRTSVERIFQVRRRQAIRLMQQWGGYQVGKTFLVDRKAVMQSLAHLLKTGCIDQVLQRKRRIVEAISEAENMAAARRARIRVDPRVFESRKLQLPSAIELVAPGKLQITYSGAEDLLARVAELAATATRNFPRFQEMVEGKE